MNEGKYHISIYFIVATIVATVFLQVYWNVQQYKVNKQRLINEVQISLDNGVEQYFANLAKTNLVARVDAQETGTSLARRVQFINYTSKDSTPKLENADSLMVGFEGDGFTQIRDSISGLTMIRSATSGPVSIFQTRHQTDTLNNLRGLANKIVISITRDSLDFKQLDTLLDNELGRKNIDIRYRFTHFRRDSTEAIFDASKGSLLALSTFSSPTYLPEDERLQLAFTNPTLTILKRSLGSILLSFLLSSGIIACLLYLLSVIKRQKQLAMIKNDLISNITHEFKTPIATIATAIESIKHFDTKKDPKKTEKYLDVSDQQLKKLHQMVEKLLETATLDSEGLALEKKTVDIVSLVEDLVKKYRMLYPEKNVQFESNTDEHFLDVDRFHMENAVGNLIDNAAKYGGDQIVVQCSRILEHTEITVADNGKSIGKAHRDKLFDKFYRIPTGNRHDVKGFGIGLYYSRNIVEKHGGSIALLPEKKGNIFKVTL